MDEDRVEANKDFSWLKAKSAANDHKNSTFSEMRADRGAKTLEIFGLKHQKNYLYPKTCKAPSEKW